MESDEEDMKTNDNSELMLWFAGDRRKDREVIRLVEVVEECICTFQRNSLLMWTKGTRH